MMMMMLIINQFNHMLFAAGHRAQGYDNAWEGILIHVCPTNQVVSQIMR